MISAKFLWKCTSWIKATNWCKNSNFEIFESALIMKSVSMPLNTSMAMMCLIRLVKDIIIKVCHYKKKSFAHIIF